MGEGVGVAVGAGVALGDDAGVALSGSELEGSTVLCPGPGADSDVEPAGSKVRPGPPCPVSWTVALIGGPGDEPAHRAITIMITPSTAVRRKTTGQLARRFGTIFSWALRGSGDYSCG